MSKSEQKLVLSKAIVSIDLETTGVWVEKDRIIEIALVKYDIDGTKSVYQERVNPRMPIPENVTELTGISNEDVKDAPVFSDLANEILVFIGDADIAGFNVERFDLPLLAREFGDLKMLFKWEDRKVYDAQVIFHLNEKRDLSAAYRFYCEEELVDAHSALADSEAAFEILKRQVELYGDGDGSMAALDKFKYTSHEDAYDSEGKFCWWNGRLYPAFGKYRRRLSLNELVDKDPGYLKWFLNQDFKSDVKTLVKDALAGKIPATPVASV